LPPKLTPVDLPQSDGAGNRLEALTGDGGVSCTADGIWCIWSEGSPAWEGRPTPEQKRIEIEGAPWPYIIRVGAEGAIYGVVETEEQMSSGGSASAQRVTLFQHGPDRATRLAVLPLSSNISIRACFSPDNEQQRAGACLDEYRFVSRVRLDESVTSGPPRIVLETAAASFPGRVTRQADSLERPPLAQADLVWATDDVCSFRRTFSQSSAGPYAPDAALPACSDYLEP
jgi:hypothetical protein